MRPERGGAFEQCQLAPVIVHRQPGVTLWRMRTIVRMQ